MAGFRKPGTAPKAAAESATIEDYFTISTDLPNISGFRLSVFGESGIGKTHLCSNAPGEIFFIDTEGTAKMVIDKQPIEKRKCIRLMNVKQKFTNDVEIINYATTLEGLEQAVDMIYRYTQGTEESKPERGTIVIDSMSDVWDWYQFWLSIQTDLVRAKTGKMIQTEWGRANKRHKELLDKLLLTGWNVVVTAQAHPVYDSGGQITQTNDAKWQKGVPFWADVSGEIRRNGTKTEFVIRKCRHEMRLVGSRIEDPTFERIVEFISKETGLKFDI